VVAEDSLVELRTVELAAAEVSTEELGTSVDVLEGVAVDDVAAAGVI
jgi:hypothetical protein